MLRDRFTQQTDQITERLMTPPLPAPSRPSYLRPLLSNPSLQLDKFDVQFGEFALVVPALELARAHGGCLRRLCCTVLRPGEEQADISWHATGVVDDAGLELEAIGLQVCLPVIKDLM